MPRAGAGLNSRAEVKAKAKEPTGGMSPGSPKTTNENFFGRFFTLSRATLLTESSPTTSERKKVWLLFAPQFGLTVKHKRSEHSRKITVGPYISSHAFEDVVFQSFIEEL